MSRILLSGFQDKDESLPWSIDWFPDLDGSSISSSSWTVKPAGLAVQDSSFSATVTTARLGGGTAGRKYTVENTITTAAGSTYQASIQVTVED